MLRLLLCSGLLLAVGCAGSPRRIARPELLEAYLRSAARPTLVVDLDDTVVRGGVLGGLQTVTGFFPHARDPFQGAPEVLTRLAPDWNLVFLTARDDFFEGSSLEWLDMHGFPRAPVIFSTGYLATAAAHHAYKSGALAELRARGLELHAGVGDRVHDVLSYLDHELDAFLIVEGTEDPDFEKAIGVRPTPVGEEALAPRLAGILIGQNGAWRRIEGWLHEWESELRGR